MKKSQFFKIVWAPVTILISHAIFASTIGHRQIDAILHFLGGAAAGYFFYQILSSRIRTESLLHKLVFSFALSCTSFLVWEIGEFFSDQLLGTHIQASVPETMTDIILGLAGSVLLVTIIYFFYSYKKISLVWRRTVDAFDASWASSIARFAIR